jgi:site-specific recombinase XerD
MQELLNQTKKELQYRNYSLKTQKAYLVCIKNYLLFIGMQYKNINENRIKDFLIGLQEKGYSPQTINLYLNSIKFLYREVLKNNYKISLKFAKRSLKIPVVLSRKEIIEILSQISNTKHKLIIALSYTAGLRVSEVANLKVRDLNIEELTIHIKDAKGKKDRITIFSKKIQLPLRKLITLKNSNDLVFESERGGRLSERTMQMIFEKALHKSNIKKDATFHSLRHSFATHLLENGTDIRYIQELLGHSNIRTTQIYAKVTNPNIKNIKSPL